MEKVRKIDQLLMTLLKLMQNLPHADMAVGFNVSQATVVVTTRWHVLHELVFKQFKKKEQTCFGKFGNCSNSFTNCRIILDCT